jgi:hypothetical protein
MNPNIQNPYSQQASLDIEQQLSRTSTLDIGYQHLRGLHLISSYNANFFGMNARLSRTFSITERVKLEGMAEASNALNHRNNMIPNGTWGTQAVPSLPNSTFGQATAVGDPRNVQLAARFTF